MAEIANDLIQAEAMGMDYEQYMMEMAFQEEVKQKTKKEKREKRNKK